MTDEIPHRDTLPYLTMTEIEHAYLTLEVSHCEDDGRTYYVATERDVALEGRGPTAPAAVAAYARRVSVEAGDGYLAPGYADEGVAGE